MLDMGDTTTDVISGDITTTTLLTNDLLTRLSRCGKLSMWYATIPIQDVVVTT